MTKGKKLFCGRRFCQRGMFGRGGGRGRQTNFPAHFFAFDLCRTANDPLSRPDNPDGLGGHLEQNLYTQHSEQG